MFPQQHQIETNLARVRERIDAAAQRSGRAGGDVTLVGVTKYVTPDRAAALYAAGCPDLGESRPQALWEKVAWFAEHGDGSLADVRWHLIGHLQRNKAHRTVPLVAWIHSADSARIVAAIHEAATAERPARVLLEVNISGDATKHGWPTGELQAFVPRLAEFPHVRVCGLMTMAALEGGTERARQDFRALRVLRDRLVPLCPPGVELAELSMGMSGDFEVAIEEGATIVRIGSALFEGCL
ncbi:MAG: YggS family pyridoxal phosphate-dependent enzyme [Planctomycetales bacterium]|nr:YggS family pyridoxal phosphate-dependent enzyme [Planctomycetales bacterium]